jgi:hypothetical protein
LKRCVKISHLLDSCELISRNMVKAWLAHGFSDGYGRRAISRSATKGVFPMDSAA